MNLFSKIMNALDGMADNADNQANANLFSSNSDLF